VRSKQQGRCLATDIHDARLSRMAHIPATTGLPASVDNQCIVSRDSPFVIPGLVPGTCSSTLPHCSRNKSDDDHWGCHKSIILDAIARHSGCITVQARADQATYPATPQPAPRESRSARIAQAGQEKCSAAPRDSWPSAVDRRPVWPRPRQAACGWS
jgi:hypothetical protein